MSEQADPAGSTPARRDLAQPYVVEHYGFAPATDTGAGASAAAAPTSHPSTGRLRGTAGARGRRALVAAALGLVLTGGVGGYAVAVDADGRGDGGRRAVALVEEPTGDTPRGGVGGPGPSR